MWSSDGTTAGTHRLTDTQIPNSSNPGSFAAIDNSPPTVANAAVSAITDQQTNHPFQNVVIGDTDLPAQTLTVTVTPDDAAKGQFTAASLTASGFVAGGVNGSYTFTGTAAQATAAIDALVYQPTTSRLVVGASETMSFTIAINDGAGGSVVNHQTVITQTSANDAPVGANNSASVNEDATTSTTTRATGVLGNDTDVDTGETATLKVSGAHFGAVADTAVAASGKTTIHGTYGDLHIATDGTYDYTPNTAAAEALPQGQAASDVFTYTVTDVHGATGTATLTFNITGQEDGPAAVANTVTATEDVAASASTRVSGLLGNDTDVDTGEAATLKVSGAHFGAVADTAVAASGKTTIHGTYGDLLIAADGTYSYTPNTAAAEALPQGQAASDVFTYTVTDVHGASGTATLTFNITGQEDGPAAVADTSSAFEDVPVVVFPRSSGLLSNGTDVDTGEAATLNVVGAHFGSAVDTAVAATGTTRIHGTYGDLDIQADGTYSYFAATATAEALPQGQTATEVFSYTIADAQGRTSTSTVTITVTGANDTPAGTNNSASVNEDATTSSATRATGVLGNDTDVDTGETATLKVSGAHFGAVADTAVAASCKTTIHVTYGDLHIAAEGTYDYTPITAAADALPQGQAASDVFTYSVTDVHGASGTATLTFNITGQNDTPPGTIASGLTATEQVAANLKGSITVADVDGGSTVETVTLSAAYGILHLAAGTSGANITANDSASVTVSGTLAQLNALFGSDPTSVVQYLANTATPPSSTSLSITVTDSMGANSTSSRPLAITAEDAAAVAANDSNAVVADHTIAAASVICNDHDVDGPTLTVSAVNGSSGDVGSQITLGSGALLTLRADGTYDYGPNHAFDNLTGVSGAANSSAIDSFTYT